MIMIISRVICHLTKYVSLYIHLKQLNFFFLIFVSFYNNNNKKKKIHVNYSILYNVSYNMTFLPCLSTNIHMYKVDIKGVSDGCTRLYANRLHMMFSPKKVVWTFL